MEKDTYVINLRFKVKKLRKRLRQIENLRNLNRPLNEEEEIKVSKTAVFRQELQEALTCLPASLAKCQDSIPTALLIPEANDDNPIKGERTFDAGDELNNTPIREERTFNDDDQVEAEISILGEESPPPKQNGETVKRQLENCESAQDVNGELNTARASPCPSSPKRIKKERSVSKDGKIKSKTTSKEEQERQNLEKIWKSSEFTVNLLEGHNDFITSVAADGNIIVSSSRDTTIKVWNADTCQEVFSLRGHRAVVSCLAVLSDEASNELSRYSGFGGSHRLVISGAADSSIILWSATSGEKKKSIYTFNTVTCVAYIQPDVCIITATDSGKLEIYDAVSGSNIRSLTAYDDGYSCVVTKDNFVFTAATDGIIKVWEVQDRNLTCVFTMDDLSLANGQEITLRNIRSLAVHDNWVYYGDDGPNLKCFNWRTKMVKKFVNQMCDCGATDAVACMGQEIFTSTYDVDTGRGHINVRHHPSGQYLCSLEDGISGRIFCLASTISNGNVRIVTGGAELKVWNIMQSPYNNRRGNQGQQQPQRTVFKSHYIPYYTREAEQSDYESSNEDSSNEDDNEDLRFLRTYVPKEITRPPGLWSYCSVL